MGRVRTTQWNLLFHYISIALMMVSGILLVPLYLQHIPMKLYGAWLATGNILAWLTAIDPGLSAILQQRVALAYGKADINSVGGYISSGFIFSAVVSIFLVFCGHILSPYIPSLLNLSPEIDYIILVHAFWIAVVGSSLQLFSYAITSINQGLQSSLGIGLIYAVVHLLDILLILLLIYLDYGLMSLAYSALFRGVGMVVGNLGYLIHRVVKEKISIQFSHGKFRELAGLVPFTFFAQLTGSVGNNIDAFVTARFLGADLVPVLVLTRKAFDICRIIISRPALALTPALSHLMGEGDTAKARKVLTNLVCLMAWVLALVVGALITFNADFVGVWVGRDFYAGNYINVMLCIVMVMSIVTSNLSSLCVALGDIKGSSLATVVQGSLFILLVTLGAKFYGLDGVVSGPLVAMMIIGAWYFPKSFARQLEMSREVTLTIGGECLRAAIAAAVTVLVSAYFNANSIMGFVLMVALFSSIYISVLYTVSRAFRIVCYQVSKKIYHRFA